MSKPQRSAWRLRDGRLHFAIFANSAIFARDKRDTSRCTPLRPQQVGHRGMRSAKPDMPLGVALAPDSGPGPANRDQQFPAIRYRHRDAASAATPEVSKTVCNRGNRRSRWRCPGICSDDASPRLQRTCTTLHPSPRIRPIRCLVSLRGGPTSRLDRRYRATRQAALIRKRAHQRSSS